VTILEHDCRLRKIAVVLAMLVSMSACTTVRSYPICYFGAKPPEEDQRHNISGWEIAAKYHLGPLADPTLSNDERWLFARGFDGSHTELAKIWPRLGCIGRYASSLSYAYYSKCLELLSEILLRNNYLLRGDKSEFLGEFYGYCNGSQRLLDDLN
jgi:hypothetical protein